MFAITSSRGFHITFENGITLSTQFGGGNYCSNRDINIGSESSENKLQSRDAEIAIWDAHGKWLTQQAYKETFDEAIGDDVKGYVKIEEWLKILNWCQAYELAQEETGEQDNETAMR